MFKKGLGLVVLLPLALLVMSYELRVTDSFAEEETGETFTITTYYPSPYGSYNELTTYSNAYFAIKSGNVGIGTTGPKMKLHISDTTSVTTFKGDRNQGLRIDNSLAGNNYSLLGFGGYSGYPRNLAQIGAKFTSSGSYLSFGTSSNYSVGITNEAMVIDYSGNVGIGTTSPGQKLTVAGTIESTSGGVKFPDGTTQTSALPAGMIAMFAGPCPTGWTRFRALDDKFLKGAATYGATGGSATHTHTATIPCNSRGVSVYSPNMMNISYGCGSGSVSSSNNEPPYLSVVWCQKN